MAPTATPRREGTVRLRDGRTMAYAEWGDLTGRPVILLHGQPGSRLFCPDEEATSASGVRLLTLDRPGYGRSDPQVTPSLLRWADDYRAFTDELGLPPSPVVGWSAGGPFALVAAFACPDHVSMAGVATGSGPMEALPEARNEWSDLAKRALYQRIDDEPEAVLPTIRASWEGFAEDPDSWSEGIGTDPDDPDDRLLARPEVMAAMNTWMREGARHGSAGVVADSVVGHSRWGFAASDIRQTVHVWWGDRDRLTARYHTEYLATTIPNAILTVYEGEGHLFPIAHWGEMLAALA